jgi:hypothetical protein
MVGRSEPQLQSTTSLAVDTHLLDSYVQILYFLVVHDMKVWRGSPQALDPGPSTNCEQLRSHCSFPGRVWRFDSTRHPEHEV